ncbi:hypothetical protein MNBD_GAMMA22-1700 [hydrothermal vent metagenome]|uniref:DUF3135 domain-containing protein n=1 Tax=hydrothermal vent metagenome TaxID=652676 RepID=A0A3B0ZTA1_9ZZZZ
MNIINNQNSIDFDKWVELAQINPKAFEELRTQVLEIALSKIDKRRRHKFECLQWRIDQIRQTSKTPLSGCIKISQLMWSSFDELILQYYDDQQDLNASAKKNATILPFKPPT